MGKAGARRFRGALRGSDSAELESSWLVRVRRDWEVRGVRVGVVEGVECVAGVDPERK
jgi:hypothetical protein